MAAAESSPPNSVSNSPPVATKSISLPRPRPSPPNGAKPTIRFHEVDVYHYPLFEHPPYDLALATRMAEVAEFYSLDLLHVHYAIPHSVCALLARQMLASRKH